MTKVFLSFTLLAASAAAQPEEPELGAPSEGSEIPISTASTEARGIFQRGRILYENYHFERAAEALREALQKDPDFPLAHLYLGLSLQPASAGQPSVERAAKLAGKASPGEQLLIQAVVAERKGDVAAEEALRRLLPEKFPKDWRAHFQYGRRLFQLQRYGDAVEPLRHALEADPLAPPPYNLLGGAYAYMGRIDDALVMLRRYSELLPGEANPHDSLAEVELLAGRFQDAAAHYQQSLTMNPQFTYSYGGLGHARLLSGDFAGAREAYLALYEKAETSFDRFTGLGWLAVSFAHEGKPAEAASVFARGAEEARKAGDKHWAAYFPLHQAHALSESGKTKEAAALLQKVSAGAGKAGLPTDAARDLSRRALFVTGINQIAAGQPDAADVTSRALNKEAKAAGHPGGLKLAKALEGWVQYARRNFRTARELLRQADENDPYQQWMLAEAAARADDAEGAEKARERVRRYNNNTLEYGYVRPRVLAGGPEPTALPVTSASVEALALFSEGRRLGEMYRREDAVVLLDRAAQKDPGFALAHLYRGIYTEPEPAGDPAIQKAVSLIEKVSEGEKLFIQSWAATRGGDAAAGERILRQLQQHFPADWRIAAYLGEHLLRLERRDEAIRWLTRATELAPLQPYPYNALGYANAFNGRYDPAIAALKKYVEYAPGEANPHDSLAEIYMMAGRFSDAVGEFARSLEIVPFPASYAGMGHARLLMGDFEGARDAYQKMYDRADLNFNKLLALIWIGVSYAHEGRLDEAVKTFERGEKEAIKGKDKMSATFFPARRALALMEMGRHDDAVKLAQWALDAAKRTGLSAPARAAVTRYALFVRGMAETRKGALDAAGKTLAELQQEEKQTAHPEAAYMRHALAGVLAGARGDAAAAAAELKQSDPRNPYHAWLLAEALTMAGDKDGAHEARERVRGFNNNHPEYGYVRPKVLASR
jgi:tetratricopeptide (TPR) repeat protein